MGTLPEKQIEIGNFQRVKTLLSEHKLWWMVPLVLFLLFVGALLLMSSFSIIAPFIY